MLNEYVERNLFLLQSWPKGVEVTGKLEPFLLLRTNLCTPNLRRLQEQVEICSNYSQCKSISIYNSTLFDLIRCVGTAGASVLIQVRRI
jgi:hypothetical protein